MTWTTIHSDLATIEVEHRPKAVAIAIESPSQPRAEIILTTTDQQRQLVEAITGAAWPGS